MAPKHNRKQKEQATPTTSQAQGDQNPDLEKYGPIFFHKENEDYGFMSNFYVATFRAPYPETWLSERYETAAAVSSSSNARVRDKESETVEFRHSEQYYMYCKAVYFGDEESASKIMGAETATDCKAAGRSVRGFSDKAWEKHDLKVRVMEEALWWKFGGGPLESCLKDSHGNLIGKRFRTKEERFEALEDLGRQLLATGERQLVEAAGQDRYWGIGYRLKDGPLLWQEEWGRNQLGKSLMTVRERLRKLIDGEKEDDQIK